MNAFGGMLIEGGLRPPMVNDSALIETPLQVKMARENLKPQPLV
jgi:hypothetical protein